MDRSVYAKLINYKNNPGYNEDFERDYHNNFNLDKEPNEWRYNIF